MSQQTQTQAPPALPAPGPQDPGLAELQAQLQSLQAQQAGLQAQWDGLKDQLDNMLRNNPARPRVQQQWADIGIQKAQVEGTIAALQARIAAKKGLPINTPPAAPGVPNFPFVAPNVVVPAVSVVTLVLLFPISVAWAKRILRRAPKTVVGMSTDTTTRLERIEHAIDTIAIEVERISEGQRFVTKVMAGRPTTNASSDASSAGSPMASSQPLALGAGPIEPIVVAERERVRQRVVTPH